METIAAIKEKVKKIQSADDPLLKEWERDTRKGVQKIVEQWHKEHKKRQEAHEQFNGLLSYERNLHTHGFTYIAGIDEVGRGPLAGPVVAAAVILPKGIILPGINDSKKLSEGKREFFYEKIMEEAHTGIGLVHAEEIDHINIYEATKKAMIQAVSELAVSPDHLLIDAMRLNVSIAQTSIIKGDAKSASIAAASIVAKVTRDRLMKQYGEEFPEYKFEKNMGYGTKEHLEALSTYGPCRIHRKSFAPIKELL